MSIMLILIVKMQKEDNIFYSPSLLLIVLG